MDKLYDLAPHGTRARYSHRTQACHCPDCTAANAAYIRGWRSSYGQTPAADDVDAG